MGIWTYIPHLVNMFTSSETSLVSARQVNQPFFLSMVLRLEFALKIADVDLFNSLRCEGGGSRTNRVWYRRCGSWNV